MRGCVNLFEVKESLYLVDAHDEHWRILGRRRDDDLPCAAAVDVRHGAVDGGEHAGGFDDVLGAFEKYNLCSETITKPCYSAQDKD